MSLWEFLTETPDARRQRQTRERKERAKAVQQTTGHPDDWGPGYGVQWDDQRKGKR